MNDEEWERRLEDLQSDESDQVIAAAELLSEVTDRSRIPDLLRLLDCDDFLVRESAASPLIAMEGLRVLPAVLRALERSLEDGHDGDGLSFEITKLVEMHESDAAPMLLTMLRSHDPREREDAAWLLGFVRDFITPEPLMDALNDPEPRVRGEAVGALGSFPYEPKVLDAVLARLDDPDEGVRVDVASTLGYLGGPRAVAALRRALEDPSEEVRRFAESSIERLGDGAPASADADQETFGRWLQLNVARVVVYPIGGLLFGLGLGLAKAWLQRMDELVLLR